MPAGETGSRAWRLPGNNRRVIAFQSAPPALPAAAGPVRLEFFGASAFRITSPAGLRVFIDPWRNFPGGGDGQWFLREAPEAEAEIGLSTHAHYDHDALHLLRADMLLDRMAGEFRLADLAITGVADKHASDFSHALFDLGPHLADRGINPCPPDNHRGFDNTLYVVETGGVRILHWGDNRPDPPEAVWRMLGRVDVLLLPVDGSRHVLGDGQVAAVLARLRPRLVVPHHYFVRGLHRVGSTLLTADAWVAAQPAHRLLDGPCLDLTPEALAGLDRAVAYFGAHVVPPNGNAASVVRPGSPAP